ncbi:AAA family ATPase [Caproiciproducens sp. R2]|uniref:AAA family ATPase n=1 Tax=Caproiciproducens sp. R2 TaxID=3435187 RepID=UPI004033B485
MATAIESITGISISSDYFSNMATLEFFPTHPKPPKVNRVALLYGKNGSGKSTIAQGFREYRDSVNPRTVTLNPLNGATNIKVSPSGKPEKFYIYDENYISSRVKVSNSGLDAIVLFGEQVSLERQIAEIEKKIADKKKEVSDQNDECLKFQDSKDVLSPDYWRATICDTLREKNGWADIGSKIKRQKVKLAVNDAEISKIGKLSPAKKIDQLRSDFDSLYARFSSIDADTALLPNNTFHLPDVVSLENRTTSLLSQAIDKPKLTQREQEILKLFNLSCITDSKRFLSDEQNIICDRCLQPIDTDYRTEALQRIKKILNREVEEFKSVLVKLQIQEVDEKIFLPFNELPSFKALCAKIGFYNKAVCAHNNAIQAKIDEPFTPHNYDASFQLKDATSSLSIVLTDLDNEIVEFNRVVKDISETQKTLLCLNDNIAHYTIEKSFATFLAQQTEKNVADAKRQKLLAEQTLLEQKKTELDLQRKNYRIAADEINDSLRYIFFSDKRLTIELGQDQLYHLKSNGVAVWPDKVSCGERNAIALSYYFTEIAKDMDANAKYSDELFLVIDDPISSFDIENRIGILSFLRWKLDQVLDGSPTTKVLLMTHDVSVVFDLEKALQEISEHCEKKSCYAEFKVFQIENKSLHDFSKKSRNEYTHLLQMVYQFAKENDSNDDLDLVIGNVMRRVLETFTSFSFKKGINDVRLEDKYLALLPDDATRTYYQNLMYRLVLNTESHAEEGIEAAPETSFWSHLSSAEKERTAKDILCFIYCLNGPHLLSHLPEAETDLKKWSSAIKSSNGSNSKT